MKKTKSDMGILAFAALALAAALSGCSKDEDDDGGSGSIDAGVPSGGGSGGTGGGGEEDACCELQQCRLSANGDPTTVQQCDYNFCDPNVTLDCNNMTEVCLAQDCGFGPPEGGACNAGQSCFADSDCCPETETCNIESGWCEAVPQCSQQFEECVVDEDCCENEDGRPVFCDGAATGAGTCAVADSQ